MFVKLLKIISFFGLVIILYFLLSEIFVNVLKLKSDFVYAPVIVSQFSTSTLEIENEVFTNVTSTEKKIDNGEMLVDYPQEIALPEQINQIVPFSSQAPEKNWDQPWQDACEEVSLIMLDAYYNNYDLNIKFVKEKIIEMVNWEQQQGWGGSIVSTKVKELAENFFDYKLKIVYEPTKEQLQQFLVDGKLLVALLDGKSLENPNFNNGGPVYHALIIKGYNEKGFITNDPGTKNGANFLYSFDNLLASMHDWNDGDVPNGQSLVLVLE
ncbi:MAG: C39 family peptidase [Candidatus Magasanikbacteria bacterium]